MSVFTDLADGTVRAAESAQRSVGSLFESRLRLGVTGLNRAGKTVFITSLLANLLQRGRMTLLSAESERRIEAAMLRPQPSPEIPRFEFEEHLAALSGNDPHWPESTRRISEVRLSLRYRRTGFFAGLGEALTGPGILHLDIVDYPGEWLLDLPLLDQRWDDWATESLISARLPERAPFSGAFLAWADAVHADAPVDEMVAKEGARLFAAYLAKARAAGLTAVSPGRFLMPGDLEGSPALTFAPVPGNGGLAGLMAGPVRGLQACGGQTLLPRSLYPAGQAGGAGRRARRHRQRAARHRRSAQGADRHPALFPPWRERLARAAARQEDRAAAFRGHQRPTTSTIPSTSGWKRSCEGCCGTRSSGRPITGPRSRRWRSPRSARRWSRP